jgi:hypothetical protein
MSDLRDWLRRYKFEQYADAFEANDIDLDILPALDIASRQGAVIFQRRAEASLSELASERTCK